MCLGVSSIDGVQAPAHFQYREATFNNPDSAETPVNVDSLFLVWRNSTWRFPLFRETYALVLGFFTIDPTLKHYEAARRLLAQAVLFACVASIVHNEPYEEQEYAPPATTWLGKASQLAWLALGYVRAFMSMTLTLWASAIFGKLRREIGWPAFVGTMLLCWDAWPAGRVTWG